MPPREIAHRIGEKCLVELERRGLDAAPPPAPPDFKRYLQGDPARRFYPKYPHWIDGAQEEAERLLGHEFTLLSYPRVSLGPEIDWHRDPITGQLWEPRFWADYDPERDPAGRDVKRVHELNRHQHLPRLAKAFYLTGNERYAAEAVAQMESWIASNPPGLGINWQSSLEIALRCVSWLWTIFLLLDSQSFGDSAAQRIGNSLLAQLEHVYRHTSRFSSPNTHLIGEAAALFISGLVFQERKWMGRGAAILIEEADKQILADGVYGELSSYYHCYALDFYLQALVLAEHNGFCFPELVRTKVLGMLRFLARLTRPDGTIPLLGDDDGGDYGAFFDLFGAGNALFGAEFDAKKPPVGMSVYVNAGYAIQRSRHDHLVFDFGGLGMLTGGHSHADALSITFFSRGRDILIDPGTFAYNAAPEWREYFRSTRAHNTVEVDGRNQADSAGTFRWKSRWSTKLGSVIKRDSATYMEAEHDAYRDLGVTHRRRLFHVHDEYVIVADYFSGSGFHSFDFYFRFGPAVSVADLDLFDTGVVAHEEDKPLLGFHASGPATGELLSGETRPIAGWVSTGYGAKQPSYTLRVALSQQAPAGAIAFVNSSPTRADFRPLAVEGAIACARRSGRVEDIAVLCLGREAVTVGQFVLQGEFFWLRLRDGVLMEVAAIRGVCLNRQSNTETETICAPSAAF
jgi:hypothetical protein